MIVTCKTSGARLSRPKLSKTSKTKNTHAIEKALKLRHVGGESISTRSKWLTGRFRWFGLKWWWWHEKVICCGDVRYVKVAKLMARIFPGLQFLSSLKIGVSNLFFESGSFVFPQESKRNKSYCIGKKHRELRMTANVCSRPSSQCQNYKWIGNAIRKLFAKQKRKTHTRSKKRWNCVTWVVNQFQSVR